MITRTYTLSPKDFPEQASHALHIIHSDASLRSGIFFDIETTGFSAQKNAIYLIGCGHYINSQWELIQWLAEDESSEEQIMILNSFFEYIRQSDTLISYNGASFDLPFIQKKCSAFHLESDFTTFIHRDLYKDIQKIKHLLCLENLKLKTVERFLGIYREDMYSGGELIPIFKKYCETHDDRLLDLLLLHNMEDIKDMLFILPVLSYLSIGQDFDIIQAASVSEHTFEISIKLPEALPRELKPLTYPLSNMNENICAVIKTDRILLHIPIFNGELKYFYKNYKDYYYLIEEDCAVHKSVAAYVEPSFRKKATAKTCYTKKAGQFLPQPEKTISPAFKFDYNDPMWWFEFDPRIDSKVQLKDYALSVLRFLCGAELFSDKPSSSPFLTGRS